MSEYLKKQKDLYKAMETPEERRARKAAKREAKNKQKMMGYSNEDNPFNDPELEKTFIWKKKYAAKGVKGVIPPEEIEKLNKAKFLELEMIKKRREEREKMREERVREMEAKQRDAEAGKFQTWAEGEEQFVFKQAKLRSAVRLREGRAKTIDILVAYINTFEKEDEEPQIDLIEPYLCLNGLRINDLEDLKEDIKLYKQLDESGNLEFWKDMEIIVDDELKKLRYSSSSSSKSSDHPDGVNPTVAKELNKIIEGKTPAQLEALERAIELKMANGREVIDITYWETLLGKVRASMARARLHDKHQELIIKIREREKLRPKTDSKLDQEDDREDEKSHDEDDEEIDPLEHCMKEYSAGQYSPKLLKETDLDPEMIILLPDEDWSKLEQRRRRILTSAPFIDPQPSTSNLISEEEREFERVARKGMGSDEGIMRSEEIIVQDASVSSWSEKYRPRKPRYFNRVHTGFEWNKYNQTHYDIDNPPPKIVQGYKFNIFYPDLIDKGKAPTYTVTPCEDNRDFAIIRFKAGPPYEDIGFKIVNREWNYAHKSGFRCQFINNILQLWFHFKRYRYRR